MATKKQATPIMDIKSPEKVKPSTTGRPIIVTTHSVLKNDPMVVAGATSGEEATEQPATAPALINRIAKTIKPLDPELQATPTDATPADQEPTTAAETPVDDQPAAPAPDSVAETSEEPTDTKVEPAAEPAPEAPAAPVASSSAPEAEKPAAEDEARVDAPSETEKPAAAASTDQPAESDAETTRARDSEAEQRAVSAEEEAARQTRERQLEALITSGKYAVPINAVQRKRSRLFVTVASVIALLLALAVLDVLLDTGLVKLPVNLPHTHFFSAS